MKESLFKFFKTVNHLLKERNLSEHLLPLIFYYKHYLIYGLNIKNLILNQIQNYTVIKYIY